MNRGRMVEGKSYPVVPDRTPYIWWFLTSRRSNTWDYDEAGLLTEIVDTNQEDWRHAWVLVKHGSWLGKQMMRINYRLFIRKRPCGCSYNWLTRKTHGIQLHCPVHGWGVEFPDSEDPTTT